MIKKRIIIFTLLFGASLITLGYCQNSQQREGIKHLSGTVSSIDWVAGKLVVRTADYGTTDEVTFVVSEDTQITKGTTSIGFSEINLSDTVTVEYISNSLAGLKATHITVKE